MNITRENTADLQSSIKIELLPEDYQPKLEKAYKEHARKANIPGFRPGKVPAGIIKQRFGISITIEEVNRLTTEILEKYIADNKLSLIGQPVYNHDQSPSNDWEKPGAFTFVFDIAEKPAFNVELDKSFKLDYYNIEVTEANIQEYVEDIRKRYGNPVPTEEVSEGSMVYLGLVELDEKNELVEAGFNKFAIYTMIPENKAFRNEALMGKKKGDEFETTVGEFFVDRHDVSQTIHMHENELPADEMRIKVVVKHINKIEPAELNEELFAKVFPDKKVSSEEELVEAARIDILGTYSANTRARFIRVAREKLVEKYPVELPKEFIKRWLVDANREENGLTPEYVDEHIDEYLKEIHWDLLSAAVAEKYEIKVSEEDLRGEIIELLGLSKEDVENDPAKIERINSIFKMISEKERDLNNLADRAYTKKLNSLLLDKCDVQEKTILWKDFLNLEPKN